MERLLARLERSLGRHVPEGLPIWLVALTGVGVILTFVKPEVFGLLVFDRGAVAHGEVWRIVTFLFAPVWRVSQPLDLLWIAFGLQILYMFMTGLESQWGSFRFLVYWLIGAVGALVAAWLAGGGTPLYLHASLLLAFATLFPDYQLLLFFVLPVKMKWFGFLSGAWVIWTLITGSMVDRAAAIAGLANYLLFCGPALIADLRRTRRPKQRRAALSGFEQQERKHRVCAKCGKSSADDPNLEFRVCDCQERCKGRLTEYCLEHARNH